MAILINPSASVNSRYDYQSKKRHQSKYNAPDKEALKEYFSKFKEGTSFLASILYKTAKAYNTSNGKYSPISLTYSKDGNITSSSKIDLSLYKTPVLSNDIFTDSGIDEVTLTGYIDNPYKKIYITNIEDHYPEALFRYLDKDIIFSRVVTTADEVVDYFQATISDRARRDNLTGIKLIPILDDEDTIPITYVYG